MKKYLIIALLLAAAPAIATNPPNPCGNHGNNCNPDPPQTTPGNQSQTQSNDQGQQQNATGTGTGIAVAGGGAANAAGGAGGAGGHGGTAVAGGGSATGGNAQGGAGGTATSGSASGAVSGSLSGVQGSGNAHLGDVGSTSAAGALSNASNGDQSLSGTQTVANTNGGNTTASGASADGSGNSETAVSIGGDHFEGSQTVYQAAMPAAAPIFGPGSIASVSYGSCGPYMGVSSEDVHGTYIGLFRKQKIYLGRSDRIVERNGQPFKESRLPDGRWVLEGQRAVRTTTVLNVSGSRQVSLGGGDTGGGYGQAGAGGGSSMQRLVTQIDLEPCIAYIAEPVQQLPVIEFKEPRVPRG